MKTIAIEEVIATHDNILLEIGGLPGLSANKSLEAALLRIENHIFYEGMTDLFEAAALLCIAIAQGHLFLDGNKRTALITTHNFLLLNGYQFFTEPLVASDMMVDIAQKKVSSEELTSWLKKYSKKLT